MSLNRQEEELYRLNNGPDLAAIEMRDEEWQDLKQIQEESEQS